MPPDGKGLRGTSEAAEMSPTGQPPFPLKDIVNIGSHYGLDQESKPS